MKLSDIALPPTTLVVEANTGEPLHENPLNRPNVTLPVGLEPPVNVAVSVMAVPIEPPGEAWVKIAGVAKVVVFAVGVASMPTIGALRATSPTEPKPVASPNVKTLPLESASQ